MSTQGFPDWQTNVPALGYTALALQGVQDQGGETYGPFYVGGYEDTVIYFRPQTNIGGWTVALSWWTDAAATLQVGQTQVEVPGQLTLSQKFANLGAYIKVQIFPTAAALLQRFNIFVQPRKTMSGSDPAFLASIVAGGTYNIIAGATITARIPYILIRNVQVTWDIAAANFTVQLQSVQSLGFVVGLPFSIDQASATAKGSRIVSLPGYGHDLVFTNNDGGTRRFDVLVTPAF